jgi:hypothetical protein
MDEDKRKHLDYLQAIITRMNTNSFQLKNMAIVILTAMFAIFAATPKVFLLFFTGFPLIVFWFLDAYYLQQERKFRAMYKDVSGLTNQFEIKTYDMPIEKYSGNGCSFIESFISKTIFLFYVSLLLIVVVIAVILLIILKIPIL